MNDISVLGKNIKVIRLKQGLSANKLAKKAGVGVATISQIETGSRQMLKGDTINKIATALNVRIEELLRNDEGSIQFESNDVCDILSIMCSGYVELDGQELDGEECLLLKNAIQLCLNGVRMRRISIARSKIKFESVKENLKVIKNDNK